MPGVVVLTQTQGGGAASIQAQDSQFFIAGLTERGDTSKPILVRGMADVQALTGNRVSYGSVWDQLQTYFNEGGQQAYVARVVGGSATVGTLTLQDRAGSPLNTLRVDAQNAGSWSSQLTIQVQNGSIANTFRITVSLSGTVVQDENNITDPAAAVTRFAKSPYVRLTNLSSGTSAPNNNPAVLSATALSAGSDDRGAVTTTTYVNSLALFTPALGDGCVAITGQSGATIWGGINAHCVQNNRIGLLAESQGASKATLLADAVTLNTEYCGLFTPWVQISDGVGGTRTISPEGYVAAARARAHTITGPWRVPAGDIAKANTLVDVDQGWTQSEANDLDAGRVSVIRVIASTIRLYGWRSLASDEANYFLLNQRDFLNNIAFNAGGILETYVFETIDARGHLQSRVNGSLVGLLDPLSQAGGLFPLVDVATGQQIDPGYKVETGSSVNTADNIAKNKLAARVSVRISPSGALITLTIVKTPTTSGF